MRKLPLKLLYRPRRVDCVRCGVRVEDFPWAEPWARTTRALSNAVAELARELSWQGTARHYGLNWKSVAGIVKRTVQYGLRNRKRPPVHVIGIDEVQFLGADVVRVVEQLAGRGIRVICAGLDQDYQGKPFEPMPQLLAIAEYITKELAICVVCGNPANRSQRLIAREERVLVGAAGAYEARCRKCHVASPAEATPPQNLDLFR